MVSGIPPRGCVLSHIQVFAPLWTAACQTPWSMGFSRQEYWSKLSFPSPGDLPNPGIEPTSPASAGGLFTSWATSEASGVTIYDTWVDDEPLTSSSSRPTRPPPGNERFSLNPCPPHQTLFWWPFLTLPQTSFLPTDLPKASHLGICRFGEPLSSIPLRRIKG